MITPVTRTMASGRQIRARSEVGLSRLPVTEEIAGSNPVGPASKPMQAPLRRCFCYTGDMKVYIARHGQTNYNEARRCNADPSVDVFLTETGIRQAKELAE